MSNRVTAQQVIEMRRRLLNERRRRQVQSINRRSPRHDETRRAVIPCSPTSKQYRVGISFDDSSPLPTVTYSMQHPASPTRSLKARAPRLATERRLGTVEDEMKRRAQEKRKIEETEMGQSFRARPVMLSTVPESPLPTRYVTVPQPFILGPQRQSAISPGTQRTCDLAVSLASISTRSPIYKAQTQRRSPTKPRTPAFTPGRIMVSSTVVVPPTSRVIPSSASVYTEFPYSPSVHLVSTSIRSRPRNTSPSLLESPSAGPSTPASAIISTPGLPAPNLDIQQNETQTGRIDAVISYCSDTD